MNLKNLNKKIRRLAAKIEKDTKKLTKLRLKLTKPARKKQRSSKKKKAAERKSEVGHKTKAPERDPTLKPKRTVSAARRAQLAAAMKERWAAKRAADASLQNTSTAAGSQAA